MWVPFAIWMLKTQLFELQTSIVEVTLYNVFFYEMIWLFDLQDCDCVVVYYIFDIALYSSHFLTQKIVFKCFCSKWRRVKRPITSWHNNLKYNVMLLITDSETRDFLLDQIYQIMWQIQTIYWFRFITVTLNKLISFSVTKTTILIANNTCI